MKHYNILKYVGIILIFIFIAPGISQGKENISSQEREILSGRKLAQKVFDRDRGDNSKAEAVMILVSKSGHQRKREFNNLRILKNGLETQLIRFTSPADIKGTGFLTIEKKGWETTQFLYLPALRRTRRIVSSQKSHRFVNSDFTYEDMERHSVDDYLYKITGIKKIGEIECYAMETRPKKNIKSQYSLTKSLIAKNSLVPVYAEYFDQRGKLIKKYKTLKLDKIQGIWTESAIMMEDLKKEHKTFIKIQHIEYNRDIDASKISKQALENY